MDFLKKNPAPTTKLQVAANGFRTAGRVGIGASFITVGIFTIINTATQMLDAVNFARGAQSTMFKKAS